MMPPHDDDALKEKLPTLKDKFFEWFLIVLFLGCSVVSLYHLVMGTPVCVSHYSRAGLHPCEWSLTFHIGWESLLHRSWYLLTFIISFLLFGLMVLLCGNDIWKQRVKSLVTKILFVIAFLVPPLRGEGYAKYIREKRR